MSASISYSLYCLPLYLFPLISFMVLDTTACTWPGKRSIPLSFKNLTALAKGFYTLVATYRHVSICRILMTSSLMSTYRHLLNELA